MKTASALSNLVALAALALPAWLVFDALGRQPGQTWQGMAFAGLTVAAALAWALAGVLVCRPRPSRATPLILTGAAAFAGAFALAFAA